MSTVTQFASIPLLRFSQPGCCSGSPSDRVLTAKKGGVITDRRQTRFQDLFCCCFVDHKKEEGLGKLAMHLFKVYLTETYGEIAGKGAIEFPKAKLSEIEKLYPYLMLSHALEYIETAKKMKPHNETIEKALIGIKLFSLSQSVEKIHSIDEEKARHLTIEAWNEGLSLVPFGKITLTFDALLKFIKQVPLSHELAQEDAVEIAHKMCARLIQRRKKLKEIELETILVEECVHFGLRIPEPSVFQFLKKETILEIASSPLADVSGKSIAMVMHALIDNKLL